MLRLQDTLDARFLSLPVRVHAARWRPRGSRGAWQPEHAASSTGSGSWSLSNSTQNRCVGMTYSGAVGAKARAAPASMRPERDRRCALDAAERTDSEVRVRNGRRPILPAVLPLSWLSCGVLRWPLAFPKFWPRRFPPEAFTVETGTGNEELCNATSWRERQF